MGTEEVRPAWYALAQGGWRDYVTVLHLPYTAWNLSYVALGAAIAPVFRTDRMLWTMAAFALALGVSAHVLDELNGRPLRTSIPTSVLAVLGVASLAGACAIGIWAAFSWGEGLLVFVAIGGFLVPAYNLEWFGGRFHNGWGLALAWARVPGPDRLLRRGPAGAGRGHPRRRLRRWTDPRAARRSRPRCGMPGGRSGR